MTSLGYINWFNKSKGFGLISSIEGDFFFHISNSPNLNTSNLKKESPVLFLGYINPTKNRAEAKKVHLLESMQDLKKTFKFWKKVNFSSQVELLVVHALEESLTYKSKTSEEDFWSFFNQLILVVEFNKSNTIVRVVKNSISRELEEHNDGKLKEYLDVKLITNWPFDLVKALIEQGTASPYSYFCFCLKYISINENQHQESELTDFIKNIFSLFDVARVIDDLIRLIIDINEGHDLSYLDEKKNYIFNDYYYKELNGHELINAVNDYIIQELPFEKKIYLYKNNYIYYLDENFLIDNISSFTLEDLKMLFSSTDITSNQKFSILLKGIKTLFYSNKFKTINEWICYAESLESDWYNIILSLLKEESNYKYNDLLINWYKTGHQRFYHDTFIKENISLFSINDIITIINRYNLDSKQKEDLFVKKIRKLIQSDVEDYNNGISVPLKNTTYANVKEAYNQIENNHDWLTQLFINEDNETCIELIISLYKDDCFEVLDHDFVIKHIDRFKTSEILQIVEDSKVTSNQKNELLSALFVFNLSSKERNINTLKQVHEKASILAQSNFDKWMDNICSSITNDELLLLWQEGMTKELPKDIVREYLLNARKDCYNQFLNWYENGLMTQEQAEDFLLHNLDIPTDNLNRSRFYVILYSIYSLSKINTNIVNQIRLKQNKIFDLILWYLSLSEIFDFNILRRFFIYFEPKEQVKVIKRIFRMAENGNIDLTIEMLESINRVDSDLYKLISEEHPLIPIDISTDIIIKALSNLSRNDEFSTDKDVLDILINSGKYKTRFKIGGYFDCCKGRIIYEWSGHKTCTGYIEKNNQPYYEVCILTRVEHTEYRRGYGYVERYVHNSSFNEILNAIKNIPGRKWDPNNSCWEIPLHEKDALFEIATKYGLKISGGNNYHMNKYESKNDGMPSRVNFCEGRPALKIDDKVKEEFLWCRNGQCFRSCVEMHDSQNWENYTLLDFCRILGLDTDSLDSDGRRVKYGKYLSFASTINRANSILEHLYCRECDEMLVPAETSNYHAFIVTKFYCNNPDCKAHKELIYISKCFNWKCNGIIDSRDSKACPNGWCICPECGSCCSDRIFEQRNNHRETVGIGRSQGIASMIGKGHLEKREFYCSDCGCKTNEMDDRVFECPKCGKQYKRKLYDYVPRERTISSTRLS